MIEGWESLYSISRAGQVWSHQKNVILKGDWSDGYHRVLLQGGGRKIRRRVHHLVLEAFVGPRPKNAETRHLNGNSSDNRAENLRWGTGSENRQDTLRHGTHHQVVKTHCPQGHEYTEENTWVRKTSRVCRQCHRTRARARHWSDGHERIYTTKYGSP